MAEAFHPGKRTRAVPPEKVQNPAYTPCFFFLFMRNKVAQTIYFCDSSCNLLCKIDPQTEQRTKIVAYPDKDSICSPTVDPADGKIYYNNYNRKNDLQHLTRIDPKRKTIEQIGLLSDREEEWYTLCMIDDRLHALIDSGNLSLAVVSVAPKSAAQTPVADFGSLYLALEIPDTPGAFVSFCPPIYDPTTRGLILHIISYTPSEEEWLVRLDLVSQRIIVGDKLKRSQSHFCGFFLKDGVLAGALESRHGVEFRTIDPMNLTFETLIGQIPPVLSFNGNLCYDEATQKGFFLMDNLKYKAYDPSYAIGTYDFRSREFRQLPTPSENLDPFVMFY